MLSRKHVTEALRAKRDGFESYEQRTGQELERLAERLARLEAMSAREAREALTAVPRPGAYPTDERASGQSVVRRFKEHWADHREARCWALSVLGGVTTLAVDGSQITPSTDYTMPVGAVQVGWFENPHESEGEYVKDIHFEILTPEEMYLGGTRADQFEDQTEGRTFPDAVINRRRFELECEVLVAHMRRYARETRDEPRETPVCFFDGSLVISFAAQIRDRALQRAYVAAVRGLLDVSRETRVPLVGYVDTSHARDLVHMLEAFDPSLPAGASITDSQLLATQRLSWGDRGEVFTCARDDRLFDAGNAGDDYYDRVCFTYLKTAASARPTRVEVPRWVLDAGLIEHVLDVIRAECVVGTGYPYAIETADAVAVITARDRERFYRLFQDFAERELGRQLMMGRKPLSKRARR